MHNTLEAFINEAPVRGLMGDYRFTEDNVYLTKTGKNAKLIDYMVEAHLNDVRQQSGIDQFYAVIDIGNILQANTDFAKVMRSSSFQDIVKACAFLAETEFSRMIARSWMKSGDSDNFYVAEDFSSALNWVSIRQSSEEGPRYGLAS